MAITTLLGLELSLERSSLRVKIPHTQLRRLLRTSDCSCRNSSSGHERHLDRLNSSDRAKKRNSSEKYGTMHSARHRILLLWPTIIIFFALDLIGGRPHSMAQMLATYRSACRSRAFQVN
jgi:hypothetical protein